MSVKSKGRRLGRMIRRITGLPLPTCMGIGKMVAQGKDEYDIEQKFPAHFTRSMWRCGDGCCSGSKFALKGPRGTIDAEYGFGERDITYEYGFIKANHIKPPTPRKVREVIEDAPDTVRSPHPSVDECPPTSRILPSVAPDTLPVQLMLRWAVMG